MTGWLYQMVKNEWSHEEYGATVCEREDTTYDVRKLRSKGGKIQPGDIIVLFYAPGKTRDPDCGICGWGVVLGYDEVEKTIDFRPLRQSDYLKTKPIWDVMVKDIINKIRGPVPRGNMWEIIPDPLTRLIQMIRLFHPL